MVDFVPPSRAVAVLGFGGRVGFRGLTEAPNRGFVHADEHILNEPEAGEPGTAFRVNPIAGAQSAPLHCLATVLPVILGRWRRRYHVGKLPVSASPDAAARRQIRISAQET